METYNEFLKKYLPLQAEAERISAMTPVEFSVWCDRVNQAHVEKILNQLRYMASTYRQKANHIMNLIGG